MNELIYTWDNFFNDAEKLARVILPNKPQSLIVVTRGGLFLGALLSEYLNIPLIDTVCVSSYNEQERQVLKIIKEARYGLPNALIIDGIIDSGETLKHLTEKYNTKSAALFYKPATAIIKPDYYLNETDKWVKFPWEVKPL